MTEKEALLIFKRAVDNAGGQAQFAAQLGTSRAYVNDVFHGRRSLGPKVLKELGLVATTTTTYEKRAT